jgi:hypothetical protein
MQRLNSPRFILEINIRERLSAAIMRDKSGWLLLDDQSDGKRGWAQSADRARLRLGNVGCGRLCFVFVEQLGLLNGGPARLRC